MDWESFTLGALSALLLVYGLVLLTTRRPATPPGLDPAAPLVWEVIADAERITRDAAG